MLAALVACGSNIRFVECSRVHTRERLVPSILEAVERSATPAWVNGHALELFVGKRNRDNVEQLRRNTLQRWVKQVNVKLDTLEKDWVEVNDATHGTYFRHVLTKATTRQKPTRTTTPIRWEDVCALLERYMNPPEAQPLSDWSHSGALPNATRRIRGTRVSCRAMCFASSRSS